MLRGQEPERKHGIYEVKDNEDGTYTLWKQSRPIRPFGRDLHAACRYAKLLHDQDTASAERIQERQENLRHLMRGEPWKIRRWR